MRWFCAVCADWTTPAVTSADVLVLPDDPRYDGEALWLTIESRDDERLERGGVTVPVEEADGLEAPRVPREDRVAVGRAIVEPGCAKMPRVRAEEVDAQVASGAVRRRGIDAHDEGVEVAIPIDIHDPDILHRAVAGVPREVALPRGHHDGDDAARGVEKAPGPGRRGLDPHQDIAAQRRGAGLWIRPFFWGPPHQVRDAGEEQHERTQAGGQDPAVAPPWPRVSPVCRHLRPSWRNQPRWVDGVRSIGPKFGLGWRTGSHLQGPDEIRKICILPQRRTTPEDFEDARAPRPVRPGPPVHPPAYLLGDDADGGRESLLGESAAAVRELELAATS